MKSQEFLCSLVEQLTRPQGCYSERDVATIRSRCAAEGSHYFLEIMLPTLDDLLLAGLSTGSLPASADWRVKKGYRHPEFLHGLWMRVFSPDGLLLPDPSINAIRAIRQISRAFKKVFEVCADERVEAAKSSFVEVDRALSRVRYPRCADALQEICQWLFGSTIGESLTAVDQFHHGPGAVAEGADTVERWSFRAISPRVAEYFGYEPFRFDWESLYRDPPKIDEIPGRLEAVPKTAVKPRLISIEPSYNQFLQQGLATQLKAALRSVPISNITDQERNKALAQKASLDGGLATVDLSEASDRIHYGLVKVMFGFNRHFLDYLDATRSRVISIDGRELLVNKFASMGSALTFPVQTMVFTTVAVYAACVAERNFSRKFVQSLRRSERFGVYGDDIVIPSSLYPTLTSTLEELGLKVNTSKSFSTGLFRESCGGDYYRGHDVTPVYVRRRLPASEHDVDEILSTSSTRNQIVERYGYGPAQKWLDALISAIVPYPAARSIPTSVDTFRPKPIGVARIGPCDLPEQGEERWNPLLQRLEARILVLDHVHKRARGTGQDRLFKSVYPVRTKDPWGHTVLPDETHLTHHGRPVSAKLKHRWVASVS